MPFDKLFKSEQAKTAMTGFLGGAAGGAVVSALTNKKSAKKLLKTGGLVALGGVAWHAYQKYREGEQGPPAGAGQPAPAVTPQQNSLPPPITGEALEITASQQALPLFQAMVAAAYADGHLTESEQNRIWQQAVDAQLDGPGLDSLDLLLRNPPSMAEVVGNANGMEQKLECYTASLLAIDEGCDAGRRYLDELGQALALPAPLIAAVERSQAQ
ncbi:MAG: DUF533 domain-containing protein [Pseudomonadota bacterium]